MLLEVERFSECPALNWCLSVALLMYDMCVATCIFWYSEHFKVQRKDAPRNGRALKMASVHITDVCKIVCTALVSQLWGHNNKVAHSIQHKPPLGQPTLQNTKHKINNSQKTGPNMQNWGFSCCWGFSLNVAVDVAFISGMRLNFDISTGHEIPHSRDSSTKCKSSWINEKPVQLYTLASFPCFNWYCSEVLSWLLASSWPFSVYDFNANFHISECIFLS